MTQDLTKDRYTLVYDNGMTEIFDTSDYYLVLERILLYDTRNCQLLLRNGNPILAEGDIWNTASSYVFELRRDRQRVTDAVKERYKPSWMTGA